MRADRRLPEASAWRLLLAVAIPGCACAPAGGTAGTGPELDIVVGDDAPVYRQDGMFLGERVIVAGTVGEVLSAAAFTLVSEPSSDEPLLVAHEGAMDVEPGQALELAGKLAVFDRETEDFERSLGSAVFEQYEGEQYLIADERRPLSSEVEFADQASFRARDVIATGTASEVLGPSVFVLSGGLNSAGGLLVVTSEGSEVREGDSLTVLGTVDRLDLRSAGELLDRDRTRLVFPELDEVYYLDSHDVTEVAA